MCYIQLLELRIDQLLCTEVKVNFDRANTPTGFFQPKRSSSLLMLFAGLYTLEKKKKQMITNILNVKKKIKITYTVYTEKKKSQMYLQHGGLVMPHIFYWTAKKKETSRPLVEYGVSLLYSSHRKNVYPPPFFFFFSCEMLVDITAYTWNFLYSLFLLWVVCVRAALVCFRHCRRNFGELSLFSSRVYNIYKRSSSSFILCFTPPRLTAVMRLRLLTGSCTRPPSLCHLIRLYVYVLYINAVC